MGVSDDRDCPRCGSDTTVNGAEDSGVGDPNPVRRCENCLWCVEIWGGARA